MLQSSIEVSQALIGLEAVKEEKAAPTRRRRFLNDFQLLLASVEGVSVRPLQAAPDSSSLIISRTVAKVHPAKASRPSSSLSRTLKRSLRFE
ncbi:hypothetical protein FRX31_002309 [Thalictrum thalictroides]|uniref:Uncharacterized protein n=1 Tax=Thalictrum thalictroides TaxID=46969 RepID=A0A7J6XED8_THATH|nr:hypothetical protein FRX31_002309 [Thalictrum thalictroides]